MTRFYATMCNHGLYAFTILSTLSLICLPYIIAVPQPQHIWLASLAALCIGLLGGATAVQMVFRHTAPLDFHIILIIGMVVSSIPGTLTHFGFIQADTEHALNALTNNMLSPMLAWLMVHLGIQALMFMLKHQLHLPRKVVA